MRQYRYDPDDAEVRLMAGLACEMDPSVLDLLCEDGFLSPAELPQEDSPARQLALIRRAIRRGFPAEDRDAAERAGLMVVKRLDSLRVWTDLVDEDVHLRAPPACA